MSQTATDPARDLHVAIEQLAVKVRVAMLEAVRCPMTRLIAGGYVAGGGGVCPLLAAHRRGGRSYDDASTASDFAGAWERYRHEDRRAQHDRGRRAPGARGDARREHGACREAVGRRPGRRDGGEGLAREGGTRRRGALAERARRRTHRPCARHHASADRLRSHRRAQGWAWLGVFRRYDDYEAALAAAQQTSPETAPTDAEEAAKVPAAS